MTTSLSPISPLNPLSPIYQTSLSAGGDVSAVVISLVVGVVLMLAGLILVGTRRK